MAEEKQMSETIISYDSIDDTEIERKGLRHYGGVNAANNYIIEPRQVMSTHRKPCNIVLNTISIVIKPLDGVEVEDLPLLALPLGTKEEEDAVRRNLDKQRRSAQRAYERSVKRATKNAQQKQVSKVKRATKQADEQIKQIRKNDRLRERTAMGPPPNAPPDGKWFWRTFSEPTTIMFCIPSSRRFEGLAYKVPDKSVWDESGRTVA